MSTILKMITFKNVCWGLLSVSLFLCVSNARAVTSNDYYQAGLTLYNTKDYDKAILYFGAAVKLDPNNAAAYQGRGNCYYAKGLYANALTDYQQVQHLRPSPQIDAFVAKVQAKVNGEQQVASATNANMVASSEYQEIFQKGQGEFRAKQYSAAIQDFEKALRQNHSDFTLYYYMGLTYKLLGDLKDAVVALGIANQRKPTPQIAAYVKMLRAKLSQDDRDWADEQLSASAGGKEINLHTKPANATDFALRLEPGFVFPNIPDFNTEGNNGVTFATNQGTASYNAAIPNLSAFLAFEPTVNLEPDIELGFLVAAIPVGTMSENYSNNGQTQSYSFGVTAFELGLNLRWLIGDGPVKFFIAAGPMLTPISVSYNATANQVPLTGNFISWGFGGQAQLGIDIHVDNNISFGPFVSLQAVSADNFTGNVTDSTNNINTTGTLYTLPNGQWPAIVPVTAGQTVPSGATPTTIDLSGVVPGFHLSMFF